MKKFLLLLSILLFFGIAHKYHLMDGVDDDLSISVSYNPKEDLVKAEMNVKPFKEVIQNFLEKVFTSDSVVTVLKDSTSQKKESKKLKK